MQFERAMSECKRQYDLLIGAIMNAQRGILQTHITSPYSAPDEGQPS
jgi:hypothetical protein